jgi:hypothetical protein
MQLPTWLSRLLTPPQRIRTWLETLLRPPAPPDDESASEELPASPTDDELPPPRLREILSLPAVREGEGEEEAEEGLAPPSRLREILLRSSALGARLAPPERLRELLQPRTRLQASLLAGIAITVGLGLSFYLSLKIMDLFSPRDTTGPALTELPPLPPASRSSVIIAPVSVSLSAIRNVAERNTPRDFVGKATNPASRVLQNADIGWTATRGPIRAAGGDDTLSLITPITGKLNVTGSLSSKATGQLGEALGSLLGPNAAKQIGSVNIKQLNASAEIKGNIIITSRPRLAAAWHLEPNFGAQVNLGDTNVLVAGAKVSVPAQIKPVIDKTVGEQLNAIGERIRNDTTLLKNARLQWEKACRSLPLQGADSAASLPALWLEVKPTRAIAAQPRVDPLAVILTIGIEAETRITPQPTKPDCPFPDKISIIPPTQGGVSIGVPIDLPFADVNKIIAAQLVGHTFPEDGSGPVEIYVKSADLAASGERLLISLKVKAHEKKSFFSLGAEATIHIWGVPVLDQEQQVLRLINVQLAVESEAAFGLLGAAARAVVPHLQQAIYQKATIDLKPFAKNARAKIAQAISDFQKDDDGVHVEAEITNLRLADIAFDSKTLRVIAEAAGDINVSVSKLPEL